MPLAEMVLQSGARRRFSPWRSGKVFEFIQGVLSSLGSGYKSLVAHQRVNVKGSDRCRANMAHRR